MMEKVMTPDKVDQLFYWEFEEYIKRFNKRREMEEKRMKESQKETELGGMNTPKLQQPKVPKLPSSFKL
jgi:hypothetical protein